MKKIILIILGILVVVFAGSKIYMAKTIAPDPSIVIEQPNTTVIPPKTEPIKNEPSVCTMDAKQCPDGSYVGRTGPKCEFAMCPKVITNTSTKAGINQRILNNGMYITPLKVTEDSRCPSDAACVWAGIIKLLVKLEVGGKTEEVTISLDSPIIFNGKQITLVDASPLKSLQGQIVEKDYVFTFRVEGSIAQSGTLKGHMNIGPICPVENLNNPCLPTAEMYTSKKIYIYKSDKKTLVKTIAPSAGGDFSTTLPIGNYYIDMDHQSVGGITGIPANIKIEGGKTITLDIDVDTGIR